MLNTNLKNWFQSKKKTSENNDGYYVKRFFTNKTKIVNM